jgi:ABC-type multidrug transport system fused ATPase/permease subunit
MLSQLAGIFTIFLMSKVITFVVDKEFYFAAIVLVIHFSFNIFRSQLDYWKSRLSIKNIDQTIQQYIQEETFKKIFKLNPSQYLEDHSAIKIQVINRGENSVQNIISTLLLTLLPTVTQVIFSLAAIAFFKPSISFLTIATLLIVIYWSNKFASYHRSFVRTNMDNFDKQNKVKTEAYQHLNLVKTTGVEGRFLDDYLKNRDELVGHYILTWSIRNSHGTKRWIFMNFSNMCSRMLLVYYAFLGEIQIGGMYAIWSWINDANSNIFNVVVAMRDLPLRYVELEKYLDIIDKKPDFNEHGDKKFAMGDIELQNVSFQYPKGERPVFENVTLTIPNGKKIAFVGFSGSGKSTIVKLLLRMYDWGSGDIKVAGKSLRDLDAQTFRQKIGYVEQHVDLFDISIRENILFGLKNKKLSEEKLNGIVHLSRIDQFFHRLGSSGLDTIIGERGVKLSGGERQRIGIARALAKDPEILIFDEATASLDTENEKYIQEAIDESSKGRTTIIIAHRLSTIVNSDIIFVMDKGKVVGQGTHEELKTKSPEYQRLIHAQEK